MEYVKYGYVIFLYVYSGCVKVSVFAVSLRLICTEWLRASTVQYGTIGNGKTWSSLRFHQQYPYLLGVQSSDWR